MAKNVRNTKHIEPGKNKKKNFMDLTEGKFTQSLLALWHTEIQVLNV